MPVYTDSPQFAADFLPSGVTAALAPLEVQDSELRPLLHAVFRGEAGVLAAPDHGLPFPHLLLSEFSPSSNYDQLIDLARSEVGVPDGVCCQAGAGSGFRGFKGRTWSAVPGNIHLAVHLAPGRPVERFEVAFTILAALSVAEALNQIAGLEGRARIKWVNDILLGDAKVSGILAYTQSQGATVTSAVLGIGVNVEATPVVEPTPFVPRACAIRDVLPAGAPDVRQKTFRSLLEALDRNYGTLLRDGVQPLLDRYREHSMVLGEEVTICTDGSDRTVQVLARGRVSALGENLELILEDRPDPITGGRLVMGLEPEGIENRAAGTDEEDGAPMVADNGTS